MSVNEPLFEETLSGLEAGLQVRLIAVSSLQTCTVSDDAENVLAKFSDFTCIPVRQNGEIIGVLERSRTPAQGPVEQCMRRLVGSMLISAGASLAELIPHLEQSTYRLVVTEGGITGIVTRSDLQQLPVRLYAFALITHLELLMREIIAKHYPNNDDWFVLLPNKLRKSIEKDWRNLKERDLTISKLECASLSAKCNILEHLLPPEEGKKLSEEREMILDLRHSVAHAGNYADDAQRGQDFIARISLIQDWIKALSPYLETQPPTREPARIPQPIAIATKE